MTRMPDEDETVLNESILEMANATFRPRAQAALALSVAPFRPNQILQPAGLRR